MMRNGTGRLRGIHNVNFATTANPNSRRFVRFPTKCLSDFNDYATLGLTPFSSKADVRHAYKRLALKYHPDVIRADDGARKHEMFREIKSAYERLMQRFEEEEELQMMMEYDEYDEWDEWMGFEGGIPSTSNFF
ncbi:hypothetical protein Nepgr_024248 [Nepenthes gracilis]|uniref:J domain-containing protein n=1 Tax=Nepenthes gracilis TaxID=150966 RepID=A0AAD3T3Y0_NEPGR|nr:hypothetical protein Nepgr_024248 [Nepenthes gracilis]